MKSETEMAFEYVTHEDRERAGMARHGLYVPNEKLAKYYGIPGVAGSEMRVSPAQG